MQKVILSWDGKAKIGRIGLGSWEDDFRGGAMVFRGRLRPDGTWSPWMKKRELREWFAKAAIGEKS